MHDRDIGVLERGRRERELFELSGGLKTLRPGRGFSGVGRPDPPGDPLPDPCRAAQEWNGEGFASPGLQDELDAQVVAEPVLQLGGRPLDYDSSAIEDPESVDRAL